MDKINIKNLEVFARHGVYPEENALGQKFVISASLSIDLRASGRTDGISLSVEYGGLCRVIKEFVENNTFKLIETVAEGLAEKLLLENPAIKNVWIEVKKPWAPVAVQLETVSVEITRGRHTAYLSIGSNIGDRETHLRFAIDRLGETRGCRVVRSSSFISTPPYGYVEQEDFLNACLTLETLLAPLELLEAIQCIEAEAGRERAVRWGPRTLDIDIIFYDDIIMSHELLKIPHIDMHRRGFVLIPLCEIAPQFVHPSKRRSVEDLLEDLQRHGNKRTIAREEA